MLVDIEDKFRGRGAWIISKFCTVKKSGAVNNREYSFRE
jgi:hypothetical protein